MRRRRPPTATARPGSTTMHRSPALERLRPLNLYGWTKHAFDLRVARAVATRPAAPAAMGRAEVLQRLRPERVPQGPHDLGGQGQARRSGGRPGGAAVPLRPSRAWPDGAQRRDFIWVGDVVDVAAVAARHARGAAVCSTSAPGGRAAISIWRMRCATRPACRARWSSSTCRRRCAGSTSRSPKPRMARLRAAGYAGQFTPLEEGVRRYVQDYLSQPDPYV